MTDIKSSIRKLIRSVAAVYSEQYPRKTGMSYIYWIQMPGEDKSGYAGMTVGPLGKRYEQHMLGAIDGSDSYFARSIRKRLTEQRLPTPVVLAQVPSEQAPAAERWHIAELKRKGYKLRNMSSGGEGSRIAKGMRESPDVFDVKLAYAGQEMVKLDRVKLARHKLM